MRLKPIAALPETAKFHNASLNSVSYTQKGLAETDKESRSSASEADLSQSRYIATPDADQFQSHDTQNISSSCDQTHSHNLTSDGEKGNETMEDKRKYTESASTSSLLLEMRIDDSIVGFGLQRSTVSGKQETLFMDKDGVVFAQEQDGKIVKVLISILSLQFTVYSSDTTIETV